MVAPPTTVLARVEIPVTFNCSVSNQVADVIPRVDTPVTLRLPIPALPDTIKFETG